MNKYLGEVEYQIGDKKGVLVYNWKALSKIHSEYGRQVLENLAEMSPEVIAKVMAIGFEAKTPDITADIIIEESPPLIEIIQIVNEALSCAYFGADKVQKAKQEVDSSKKK